MHCQQKKHIIATRTILFFIVLCFSLSAKSQNEEKRKNFFGRTIEWVDRNFVRQDTFYVFPNRYNLFVRPRYTYKDEFYHFSSKEENQNISLNTRSNNKMGLYFGWRGLAVGYNINLNDHNPEIDFDLGLYTSGLGLELLYQKRSEGYHIKTEEKIQRRKNDKYFNGISITQGYARLFYVFNYKRFSFPSAYAHKRPQRISAGSFLIGATYQQRKFDIDYTKLDYSIQTEFCNIFKFNQMKYMNISINTGYSYNWVFAKNFVANISFIPAIGYKISDNSKNIIQNINCDIQARMAIVYNNGRYFAGADFLSHTYFYNNNNIDIIQGINRLRLYVGYNFWRKKQNR